MITHKLIQGSPEWHEYRRTQFNASDAPAMLGCSPYKTRTELLHEMATGIYPEIDEETQRRFDDGHRFEALARPLAEEIIGDDLYPEVGGNGKLSASFDGLTANHGICFEHKTLNASLKDITRAGQLPEQYRVQMEQQLWLSGATKCLFMASKWDGESLVQKMHVWYESDQDLRDRIIQGWVQFAVDLDNYVPTQIAEKPIADAITDLPALFVQARGEITASNMEGFGAALAVSLANTRSIVLITDQDYANAEAAAKLYRETCNKLVLVKDAVLAQATTIGEATRMIDAWHEDLRVTALKLEKDVTEKKEAQKLAIITEAKMAYIEHVTALELEIKPIRLSLDAPEFAAALKGKRLIKAWHDSANTLLANSKILADAQAKDMREKLAWCKETSSGFGFLFNDLAQIIVKPLDDFKLLVTSRIDAHKVAETAKLELERERIRVEEEAKAKAKIEAEALAKADAVLSDKAEADAKAKRIQDDLQRAREERASHETETVAVSEKSAEIHSMATESVYPVVVDATQQPAYPGDAALLKVIMERYSITKGHACDWILLASENMRQAA
jgi:putative phage-type endonuclease